jgi:hypothetical protein
MSMVVLVLTGGLACLMARHLLVLAAMVRASRFLARDSRDH